MLLAVVLGVVVLVGSYHAFLFLLDIQRKRRMLSHLPTLPSWPIVGSLPYMDLTPEGMLREMVLSANKTTAEGGNLGSVWVFHQNFAQPLNGKAVKTILDSTEEITKGGEYDALRPWLGRGLLTRIPFTGDRWRHHRRLLTPVFHFAMLDGYVEAMNRHAKIFVDEILVQKCDEEVDLYPLIRHCTFDIICETTMGSDLAIQRNPLHPYASLVQKVINMTVEISMKPILWSRLVRKLIGYEKRFLNAVEAAQVLEKRIEAVHNGTVEQSKRVFIDLFTQMKEENLSFEDLREEVDTFMFEGFDTTASGLCWIIICLACNPQVQQQVYEEIVDVLGDDHERDITRSDLHKLAYLERTVKETFRLFPPVPVVMRMLQNDFQSGPDLLPKGTTLMITPITIHRNEQIYPDMLKFDPDRFLPDNISERHPYDYIPFSAGPRNCIVSRCGGDPPSFRLHSPRARLPEGQPFRGAGNRRRANRPRPASRPRRPLLRQGGAARGEAVVGGRRGIFARRATTEAVFFVSFWSVEAAPMLVPCMGANYSFPVISTGDYAAGLLFIFSLSEAGGCFDIGVNGMEPAYEGSIKMSRWPSAGGGGGVDAVAGGSATEATEWPAHTPRVDHSVDITGSRRRATRGGRREGVV